MLNGLFKIGLLNSFDSKTIARLKSLSRGSSCNREIELPGNHIGLSNHLK